MEIVSFSIIIPAYNAEKCIERSIRSILRQSYKDFEIIVVDDGSTDDTYSIASGIDDPRIRVITQQNQGVSAARNTGIGNSEGKFICFLDADDAWLENHLETFKTLQNKYKSASFFVTGYRMIYLDGRKKDIHAHIAESDYLETNLFEAYRKFGYFFNTNCVCVKRNVFEEVGGFAVGVKNEEDFDMWCRLGLRNNIVISREITSLRFRDYSIATKEPLLLNEWIFESRIDNIFSDNTIPKSRIEGVKKLLAERKITKVRQYLLTGNKQLAIHTFRTIHPKSVRKRRWLETLACIPIPSFILQRIARKQGRGLYKAPGDN